MEGDESVVRFVKKLHFIGKLRDHPCMQAGTGSGVRHMTFGIVSMVFRDPDAAFESGKASILYSGVEQIRRFVDGWPRDIFPVSIRSLMSLEITIQRIN